jgi:hypothetical protein
MKREAITIENGLVSVPQSGEIRMTAFEIAALFEVYVRTIKDHAKAILKSGVIKTDDSYTAIVTGSSIMPDEYGLDMITTLAFKVHSPKAEIFREWVIRRMTAKPSQTLVVPLSKRFLYN